METKQKTQMTPGPWQVGGLLVSGRDGTEIAMVRERAYDGPAAPSLEVADYNAAAIAALPEVLTAAEEVLADWEHSGEPPLNGLIGLRQLRALREAVNRARGKVSA